MSLEIRNVNVDDIRCGKILFRVRILSDAIEIYRMNKHILKQGIKERKWVSIPITFSIKKGAKYKLSYALRATCNMSRSLFMTVGLKAQVFNCIIKGNEINTGEIEFVSELEGDACITITATDIPIASNYIWIYKLCIEEVS